MCTLAGPWFVLSSIPGTMSSPVPFAAAKASCQPADESWSVRAMVPRPASTAARTSCVGVSVPSEIERVRVEVDEPGTHEPTLGSLTMARVLAAIVVIVVIAALLVTAWPQLFGLERTTVIVQLVSIRGLLVAIGLVVVIALTLAALLAAPARRFAATLAVAVLVFCAINVAVLSTRGFGNAGFESATENDVTVLAWNTLGDIPSPDAIAQLVVDTGAEVVALSETTEAHGLAVVELLAAQGLPMTMIAEAYDDISKARSTVLLISESLGEYVQGPTQTTTVLPTVIAAPADRTGPVILAVHAVAPIPGEMDHWRQDLQWLADACAGGNVIMAGDFNSTLDHYRDLATEDGATLGTCFDGGLATDNGAVGTWPTAIPALLGAPIDHVMATPNWRFSGMRVIESVDREGSDHRPVLAQLTPAG